MRVIKGWPFIVCIAIPLVLASLGAINLSSDLLNRVEASSASVEQQRNEAELTDFAAELRAKAVQLVRENAAWDDAYQNTLGQPNAAWLNATWNSRSGTEQNFDIVTVLDTATGAILHTTLKKNTPVSAQDLFGDATFEALIQQFNAAPETPRVVSGFAITIAGPAVVAVAPITSPANQNARNNRVLYMAKLITPDLLLKIEKQTGVKSLGLMSVGVSTHEGFELPGLNQVSTLQLHWHSIKVATPASWSKARLILAFLLLVMTGIGYFCWRLVQKLVEDEDRAKHNALHDDLTGLPNRSALTAKMHSLQLAKTPYALAFADLDGFKEVNDSYGHEYGDRLLIMVAAGLRNLTTNAEIQSRLGGDEFVVLFSGDSALRDAKLFASQLIGMLKDPFDMDGRLAAVGASVGIANTFGIYDENEMLRRSDIAMYKAKAAGKNRFCVFDASYDIERENNLRIAKDLKSIIADGTIEIAFQPIVEARSGQISGVEALARWPSSSPTTVPADKFIAVAETSGLIDALGAAMLDRACSAARLWPDLRMAINISAVQLNNPGFVQRSLAVLQSHGISPSRVEFEITETSLIHDTERAKQVFVALQQAGIKVALDDFGTGFSSIGYLRTFKFDRIKIDKSIVQKVLSSAAELAIVQGTLLVARGLSADVTAEGIESAEVASILRLAGCTELQGFHYHKPMKAEAITTLLTRQGVAHIPRSIMVAS
jgi:diguanylate cyclase (GGDEF)-like protein